MTDSITIAVIGAIVLALAFASLVLLKAWSGWLDYKRLELAAHQFDEPAFPPAAKRIELADLKERVRKLEAIAAGIDL